KGSKAETELRGLRSEQSARIRETYSACLEPINSVFNALLRRGVFSNGDPGKNFDEVTFDNHFNPYRLKQWQNFSEENPRVFGELKEKIEQLKKRGEQIGPRRNKIIEQYNNIRKEVDNRSQKLSTKLDEMFASIS
ncbi:MAG: hypothetical protein NT094_03355, partial [Candidatus Staskawiczbacteria bacterium]|nr:hypothetical protein [Candidatus Staskawiczbacteria bacterium]